MSNLDPLWRFIGSLHVMEDPGRAHVSYDGFTEGRADLLLPPAAGLPAGRVIPDFEDIGSQPQLRTALPEAISTFHLQPLAGHLDILKPGAPLAVLAPPLPRLPAGSHEEVAPPAQDFAVAHEYLLDFGHDVSNSLVTINQANVMALAAE